MSLAFLTASSDGSSGSSGSDGTGRTGETWSDGAAGTDGTIAVPSADSDLGINASTTTDTDMTLWQVTPDFTVSGTDNLTAHDQTRYYGDLGTSTRAKSVAVTITQFTDGSPGSWPMDTWFKATDNFTVSAIVDVKLGSGDGSITRVIINPEMQGVTRQVVLVPRSMTVV